MIVGNNSPLQKKQQCSHGLSHYKRYEIGQYPELTGQIKLNHQYIYLEKGNKLILFDQPHFKGTKIVFYGNNHIIHVDLKIQSLVLKQHNKQLILCIKLLTSGPICGDQDIDATNRYGFRENVQKFSLTQTLWFPIGVYEDPKKYNFSQLNSRYCQIKSFILPGYILEPFQRGIQVILNTMKPDAVIKIRDQTPLNIYRQYKYNQIQLPQSYEVVILNNGKKLFIKSNQNKITSKENKQFVTIYKSQQNLTPMTNEYILEIHDISVVDCIMRDILNISICNNETKQLLQNSVYLMLFILIITTILHQIQIFRRSTLQKNKELSINVK